MPLKCEPMEEPILNLTPMIDVVLNLVIFFMLGTQFTQRERKYEIELPTVSTANPLTATPDELIVNVTRDGAITLGADPCTPQELETSLVAARQAYADQAVVVRGDGEGKYQSVMTVLDVCKRAQITNVRLANRLDREAGR